MSTINNSWQFWYKAGEFISLLLPKNHGVWFYRLKSFDIISFVMWSTESWNRLHRREARLVTNYHKLVIIRSHELRLFLLCCGKIHSACPMLVQCRTKKSGLCDEIYCARVQTLCWLLLQPLCHSVTLGLLCRLRTQVFLV